MKPLPTIRSSSVLSFGLILTLASSSVSAQSRAPDQITPILQSVLAAPVPFTGSDGMIHLVYEVWLTNFSSQDSTVESVTVWGDGQVLQVLGGAPLAARIRLAGQNQYRATLAASVMGMLSIHVVLPPDQPVPRQLHHQVTARVRAAPPGLEQVTRTGGEVEVDQQEVVVVGPPLKGRGYVSADSCCDAVRHTRAALPVNGRIRLAQRFAVDWEQLDEQNRIYHGPRTDPKSYTIYGQEALAVAEARVERVTDGLSEQTPGTYPAGISLEEADGNSVVLDLGQGRYALYAHFQPGSIRVKAGDQVARGQVLGLVGNSGNSVAPHLHFHVMDGPSPLDSNGLPYLVDSFQITGTSPSTAAFDEAEEKGTPLAVQLVSPPQSVNRAMPLDQLIVEFKASRGQAAHPSGPGSEVTFHTKSSEGDDGTVTR